MTNSNNYVTFGEFNKPKEPEPYYEGYKKQNEVGVIAQDVEKIYPEIIGSNNIGYKTINYQEIIPLMLAKIKLMQEEIDELKIDKSSKNK